MAYTALYREWRPKNFEDVIGQEHVTTTLKNQIKNNRIAHAYLFCGTRGTGKTSAAKVFAKAINCLNLINGEPCNTCEMCTKINNSLAIDVSELDAASNNGVDNIRDIIDDVKYPPQEGKYKIYIMDEVHMLSSGAVNAFLKTLEEPPENVVFILATTDPQRLPITILSRCQRFDFKRIGIIDIVKRLKYIANLQKVVIEDKSLNLIAKVADGAMRDALSILDQAISMGNGTVVYENLINMLGMVANDNLYALVNCLIEKNIKKAITIIDETVYSGKDMYMFIKDLIQHYRNLLMIKVTENPDVVLNMSVESALDLKKQSTKIRTEDIMRTIRILQECEENAKVSKQGRMYLELSVLKICKIEYDTSNDVIISRINILEEKLSNNTIEVSKNDIKEIKDDFEDDLLKFTERYTEDSQNDLEDIQNKNDLLPTNETKSIITLEDINIKWQAFMEELKHSRELLIYASLVTGKPTDVNGNAITITFPTVYSFNIDRLNKNENMTKLRAILNKIYNFEVVINFKIE